MANSIKVACQQRCPAGARAWGGLSPGLGTWAWVVQSTVGHWGSAEHPSERFGSCSLVSGDGAEGL